jgi:hypothetical protein
MQSMEIINSDYISINCNDIVEFYVWYGYMSIKSRASLMSDDMLGEHVTVRIMRQGHTREFNMLLETIIKDIETNEDYEYCFVTV